MPDLSSIRHLLLDMDGTLYLGQRVFPAARPFLAGLERAGIGYLLITNNSSLDAAHYAQKLARMGLAVPSERIFTSGEATAIYLMGVGGRVLGVGEGPPSPKPGTPTSEPQVHRLLVLGTPTFEDEMRRAGFELVDKRADCVVLGFDLTLTYDKVRRACREIRAGARFVASHPDLVCPTEDGPIPDAGAMAAMITAATGVAPVTVGKPSRLMVETALLKLNPQSAIRNPKSQVAMVGDRLYTDMRMAREAGLTAILVLTGETRASDLADTPYPPDHVFPSIAELGQALGVFP